MAAILCGFSSLSMTPARTRCSLAPPRRGSETTFCFWALRSNLQFQSSEVRRLFADTVGNPALRDLFVTDEVDSKEIYDRLGVEVGDLPTDDLLKRKLAAQ